MKIYSIAIAKLKGFSDDTELRFVQKKSNTITHHRVRNMLLS